MVNILQDMSKPPVMGKRRFTYAVDVSHDILVFEVFQYVSVVAGRDGASVAHQAQRSTRENVHFRHYLFPIPIGHALKVEFFASEQLSI